MRKPRSVGMDCPHCGQRGAVRSSSAINEQVKEVRYECLNEECDCAWTAQLAVIHLVRPSHIPNPLVNIPLSPRARTALPASAYRLRDSAPAGVPLADVA